MNRKKLDFSVFKGGWSYTEEEMYDAVSILPIQQTLKVLEFGCGKSTVSLFKLLSEIYTIKTYKGYESCENYLVVHPGIECIIYEQKEIQKIDTGNEKYDLILIDGPVGARRKFWYEKIVNNVKSGTVILIDDWCHHKEYEQALVNDFGSKVDYREIETRKEFDPNSEPFLGYKSWKIVKVK